MSKYVLIYKVKNLTVSQANRLQAESSIRAKKIAPQSRNIIGIEDKGGNKK